MTATDTTTGFRPIHSRETEYRPIAPHAIIALGLGLISVSLVFYAASIPLAIIGLVASAWSWRKFRHSLGSLAGNGFAVTGLCLSSAALAGGSTYQMWSARHERFLRTQECLPNHLRLVLHDDFPASPITDGTGQIDSRVTAINGRQVCVRGVGFSLDVDSPTDSLLLLDEPPYPMFGWSPRWSRTIRVELQAPADVWFPGQPVAASGTLQINPKWSEHSKDEPAYVLRNASISQVLSRWQ